MPNVRLPSLRSLALLATAGLVVLLSGPTADAARSSTYVDARYGFEIRLPGREWTQTPLQPGEDLEVAKFKDDRLNDFASLSIFRFAADDGRGEGESPTTPGEGPASPPEPGDGGEDGEDGEEDDTPEFRLPPGWGRPKSAKEYFQQIVLNRAEWYGIPMEALPEGDEEKIDGVQARAWVLELENQNYKGSWTCYVAGIVAKDGVEYLILFRQPRGLNTADKRNYLRSLKSFAFAEGGFKAVAVDQEEVEDRGEILGGEEADLLDPEKRGRIKTELLRTQNWRYIDTPHYIVVYNCDRPLAKYIAERIEYMREHAFEVVFPPVEPITECMVVRVCKEMDEYHHYGGPGGSAGYWYSVDDELVFPDLSSGKKPDEKTIGVLHHEGFHQYINYALLKNDPPVWFNEGFAEYFFCVNSRGKKLTFEKRHSMRYGTVKSALGTGELIPVKDFIRLSHMQYMQRADLCYAQGWAFSTWLKNVTKNERYQEIPRIFFQEMQRGYVERAQSGGGRGWYGEEGDPVTNKALEKAFEGIDLEAMDEEFRNDLKRRM